VTEPAVERAELLIEAGRPVDAEREVRNSLLEHPGDAHALGLLARALIMQGRGDEAAEAAREAVAHDPEDESALFVLAVALLQTGRAEGAESTIRVAIRVDPTNAALHQTLAEILLSTNRAKEAVESSELARALAPYDADVVATHAHALAVLNRSAEAEDVAREALAIDPENDRAHHVLGLVGLHRADPDQALAGFREALRLDPTDESAREGLVLALKARHPVYARLLQFFLWESRLPKEARWALVFAPLVVGRLIRTVHNDTIFFPLAIVFIGLIVLTWAAEPVMTLALLATREGRRVVSHESRTAATLFGAFLAAAVATALAGALYEPGFLIITFAFVVFALAVGNVDSLSEHRRKVVFAAAAGLVLLALVEAALIVAGAYESAGFVPAVVLILGAAASLWYVRFA
jgi:Flp pilus assembly protein TadD